MYCRALTLILLGITLAACNSNSGKENHGLVSSFEPFQEMYNHASNGGSVDCAVLVNMTVNVPTSNHMEAAHNEHHEEADVFDFMALTGQKFETIPACQSEIEIARSKMCDSIHAQIADINLKNETLKNSGNEGGWMYGFSTSNAAQKYCGPFG